MASQPSLVPAARMALLNQLSLHASQRASQVRPPAQPAQPATPAPPSPAAPPAPPDDELLRTSGLNDGLGYAPDPSAREAALRDAKLRGKLLGKRKSKAAQGKAQGAAALAESESDDDEGRSSLGRRKKAKKDGGEQK
ncbi:uncharacterized protein UV8b_01347 [Ustilaginoidea virens]|uniref:Uncharacterized protein n=1 Tax=Ustilaginoidea virens TaxID=1159556 RepID=A0A8E5MF55_USTVR|nr:uncharacterized protein UV8b_01347 [Ustilaginoidea virens]QUC17106.1 hypothetical protein UV8b_01347 [Ustilaginoidea virens]